MKKLKSILLSLMCLPAFLLSTEIENKKEEKTEILPYISYVPHGTIGGCPAVGIRYQEGIFLVDVSIGGRYLAEEESLRFNMKKHLNYIFNPKEDSQHYVGIGHHIIYNHFFNAQENYVTYAPMMVIGNSFLLNNHKKVFMEIHYMPYVFGEKSKSHHLPEIKIGCCF